MTNELYEHLLINQRILRDIFIERRKKRLLDKNIAEKARWAECQKISNKGMPVVKEFI